MGCTTASKVLAGVGALLLLVSGILFVVAAVTGNSAVSIEFAHSNSASFTVSVATSQTRHCGFGLYAAATDNCNDVATRTDVTDPNGNSVYLFRDCSSAADGWMRDNDPPLQKVGHFLIPSTGGVSLAGHYRVSSGSGRPLWAVDACQQLGEAVTGILAAMGIFVCAIVALIIALILFCVSCCCMSSKTEVQTIVIQGQQQPGVVGQPVSVVCT